MYCKLTTFYNTLSVYIDTYYPHFETCHAVNLFLWTSTMHYSHMYITATTTDWSCSCPHYHGYTANSIPIPAVLPWLLSPFQRVYRRYCPHYRGYQPIPPSLSPCHSLADCYVVRWPLITVMAPYTRDALPLSQQAPQLALGSHNNFAWKSSYLSVGFIRTLLPCLSFTSVVTYPSDFNTVRSLPCIVYYHTGT